MRLVSASAIPARCGTDSSNWPVEYSGWNCITPVPCVLERPDQVAVANGLVVGEDAVRCTRAPGAKGSDPARRVRRASSATRGRTRARRRRAARAPRPSAARASCARTTGRTAATGCPPGPAGRPAPSPSPATRRERRPPSAGSGIRRVSPAGPLDAGGRGQVVVDQEDREGGGQARPRTGTTSSKRRSGTIFTRVTPSGPTTASATSSTPAAASRRATVAAVGAAAALGRVGGALRVLAEGLRTAPGTPCAPSRVT